MEKLLTIAELADRLGIQKSSAYHWLSDGRLPCIRLSKRCVRFRESDVEKMLDQFSQKRDTHARSEEIQWRRQKT
jgi:excisionase family DNA binding protein